MRAGQADGSRRFEIHEIIFVWCYDLNEQQNRIVGDSTDGENETVELDDMSIGGSDPAEGTI